MSSSLVLYVIVVEQWRKVVEHTVGSYTYSLHCCPLLLTALNSERKTFSDNCEGHFKLQNCTFFLVEKHFFPLCYLVF